MTDTELRGEGGMGKYKKMIDNWHWGPGGTPI